MTQPEASPSNNADAGRGLSEGLGAGAEAKCATPDKCRIQATGPSWSTCVYYPPIYDGHGNNLNPDGNRTYTPMRCSTCGREWSA